MIRLDGASVRKRMLKTLEAICGRWVQDMYPLQPASVQHHKYITACVSICAILFTPSYLVAS